jgi:16S rRNA (guanine527-N7)-methyltransferase
VFHVKHPDPLELDQKTRARLDIFANLLIRWNERINLVSPRDIAVLWPRHIDDSRQLTALMPSEPIGRAVDLGSGAGFPGLVLAIIHGIHFDLIESDARKATFLREAARETEATVTVHNARIDTVRLSPVRLVTARALAPLDKLLGWAAPFLAEDGFCLFPKGRTTQEELTRAARRWHMRVERVASRTDGTGTILKISEVRYLEPHANH